MSTILVIDDLEANRNVLVTLLRYKGHRLLEAANGREALALVYSEAPDLIITDVLMPVMDGFEFVRQLKLEPFTSTIPVIFYTAHYGEREARSLAHSSGVVHVLTKPTEPEEVLEVVARILDGAPEQKPVVSAPQLSPDFDREHLRLVTDKLSEKADDLNRANARLRALIDIGLELASERDSDRLLDSVCESARKLFGASYVTLGVHDRDDVIIRRIVACGTAANWIELGSTAPGILKNVVQERRPRRAANIDGDPAALGLPATHPRIAAFLAAPLVSPAHVYGWICLVSNEGNPFTDDEEGLLIALAGQVGRIYENGYFYALAQSERDRAQRYLDTAEVILLALDTSGRVVQVNRYACDVLGWTAAELIGREWVDTCVPDEGQRELRARLSQVVTGDLGSLEYSVQTRAGEVRQIEWHTTLLRDESGRVIGTLSSGTDITERTRAEEEARHQARLLALSAAIGLAMTAADSIENALQQCAQALVHHLGAAVACIWTPDERNGTLELRASAGGTADSARPTGAVATADSVISRIASERRPRLTNTVTHDPALNDDAWIRRQGLVAFAGYPLVVENTVVAVITLYARSPLMEDILEELASAAGQVALGIARYKSALRVQRAEARTQFALQSANVGIWDIDYATGDLRWSKVIEKQYGFPPDRFPGTFDAFLGRVHPDDREKLMETFTRAKATGSEFTTEHRAQWPDGTVRWVSGSGRVQLDEGGNAVRAVGISMDITERRSLEQQYQQAQKMEAVGRLAGGVAHDFNNLLNAIIGYCELLLVDFDPHDPRRADLNEIHNAALSAASLTHQLLAFSRKQIIEPTVLDLNAVMNDIRRMLGRLIGEDVNVVLSLQPGLANVKADRGQVEQIVLNLAVNARDAMPAGGTLTIETANVQLDDEYARANLSFAAGTYVVLTVTDTGTGMTPDVQARLFEPFFTTKELGKGTGLGLATVHGIVTRAGGAVHVYSEPGIGTAFKVYFPTADEEMADRTATSPVPERRQSTGASVLVVEDAEGIRKLAKRILERAGYRVYTAANAGEAGEMFDAQPIDVLLTDVVMPGASGPELANELAGRRAGLKVVYMSGYTEETIVHHGIVQTGVAFLHKPFNADALTRKVREVLDS